MTKNVCGNRNRLSAAAVVLATVSIASLVGAFAVHAANDYFEPGNLVVSRSVYVDTGSIKAGITVLPPDCSIPSGSCTPVVTAVDDSTYPFVFNNDGVDSSFGVPSNIF